MSGNPLQEECLETIDRTLEILSRDPNNHGATQWEMRFLADLHRRVRCFQKLTMNQAEKLEQIRCERLPKGSDGVLTEWRKR